LDRHHSRCLLKKTFYNDNSLYLVKPTPIKGKKTTKEKKVQEWLLDRKRNGKNRWKCRLLMNHENKVGKQGVQVSIHVLMARELMRVNY